MQNYVLFRAPGTIGPDFNEASERLKKNPHVLKIGDAQHEDVSGMAMMFIATDDDAGADASLRKSLPGWTVGNRKGTAWE